MNKKQSNRRKNLLQELTEQGIRYLLKEFVIFIPYYQNPKDIPTVRNLMEEFHFAVQLEIV